MTTVIPRACMLGPIIAKREHIAVSIELCPIIYLVFITAVCVMSLGVHDHWERHDSLDIQYLTTMHNDTKNVSMRQYIYSIASWLDNL